MKDIIYVTGHKNPDSDSVCAAISYAEFKNKTQNTPAIPVVLGKVNQETQYILDYFNVSNPRFLETVKLKIEDLDIDRMNPITSDVSLRKAWAIMNEKNLKSIPVANSKNQLVGMLSTSDITGTYMNTWEKCILAKSNTSLKNIVETLDAKTINVNNEITVFPGNIVVGAMSSSSLINFVSEGDIAIVGNRIESQKKLLNLNISLMVIAGGLDPSEEVVTLAKEKNISVIVTPYDSFTTSRLIVQSLPVEFVMAKENIISFSTDELVEDVKVKMSETRYSNYPVIDEHNRVIGTIARFHLISNNKKKVIQVDHNERGQSVNGLEDAEILEIIDHHRVADIQTGNPIYFRNEPLGSTSTIVSKRFFENGLTPSREVAGLLCGAIISDTLLFKSPTCTPEDIEMCNKLAQIAGIKPETFAKEMFKAGTSLKGKSVEEIFNQDFKPFTIEGVKIGVAQVNTMDIEGFMPLKEDMLSYMKKKAENMGLSVIMLLLTDIINEGSQLLVAGNTPQIAEEAFKVTLEDSTVFLPGVLSRKKQVIPPVTATIIERISK